MIQRKKPKWFGGCFVSAFFFLVGGNTHKQKHRCRDLLPAGLVVSKIAGLRARFQIENEHRSELWNDYSCIETVQKYNFSL